MPHAEPPRQYVIGVMTMDVEERHVERFRRLVNGAVRSFDEALTDELGLRVELTSFDGPHLTPSDGAYAPLDFLQIGLTEKLERGVHFLLIVTEVDLAATSLSYTLALPSRLTNIGLVSTKRLDPAFWGDADDGALAQRRLTHLLLHTFGHLVNLSHTSDPGNAMFDFGRVEALEAMEALTPQQHRQIREALPREAHERTARRGRWVFALGVLARDARSIARAVGHANPLRLASRLPTMITAALSVIIVVFFSPEVWDVASTVELYQLVLFAAVSVAAATFVLYRAFALGHALGRGRVLAESTVVTAAAVGLSVMLTMLLLLVAFGALAYFGTATIFPQKLMETWPTVDPAVRRLDHLKLSLFVAALGLLAGSLGGRADSRDLVRTVLFIDEET